MISKEERARKEQELLERLAIARQRAAEEAELAAGDGAAPDEAGPTFVQPDDEGDRYG